MLQPVTYPMRRVEAEQPPRLFNDQHSKEKKAMMGLEQMRYNGQEIHVVRKTLLAYTPLELPKLCPICGQEEKAGRWDKKALYYTPIWVYFTLLISPVALLIVYLIARKRLDMSYFRCDECRKRKLQWAMGSFAFLALSFGVIPLSMVIGLDLLGLLSIPIFFVCIFFAYKASFPLRAKGYSEGHFIVSGAHTNFLTQVHHVTGDVFS